MEQVTVCRTGKDFSLLVLAGLVLLLLLFPGQVSGQTAGATTHTIFMAAIEIKGGTSADSLAPPAINPKDLSKGYDFKGPGEADKGNPKRWEVSSYIFSPAFVTVRQGDTVKLTVFIVNGDEHQVWVAAPDGKRVVAATKWNRGREYTVEFAAQKIGTYQLVCSEHAPSMVATFLVVSRR